MCWYDSEWEESEKLAVTGNQTQACAASDHQATTNPRNS